MTFHSLYNKDYLKKHNFLGSFSDELFWQMEPSMSDSLQIANKIEEIIQ